MKGWRRRRYFLEELWHDFAPAAVILVLLIVALFGSRCGS